MAVLTPVCIGLAVILFIYLVLTNWRYYYLLKKLPGPKAHPILGHAYEAIKSRDEISKLLYTWMREMKSHSVACAWIFHRPLVFVLRHDAAEVILSSSLEIGKSSVYELMQPWLGLGLLTSTGNRWRTHRKLLTPSFHFRILENFIPIFNEQSQTLVSLLSKRTGSERFDVYPYITRCALDVICETAMGKRMDSQLNKNNEYFNALNIVSKMIFTRGLMPWLTIPWIFELTSLGRIHRKSLKILHDFTNSVIKERRKLYEEYNGWKRTESEDNDSGHVYGSKNRKAFLDTMIEASINGEMGLTDEIIREQTDTFMFEGHDTTAVNMTWVIYFLGWCPSVQQVAHQEIDRIFGNSDRPVNLEDINELKYLEAVIKETLRLIPSVPFLGRRLLQDLEMGGYTIPGGAEVYICPSAIGQDASVYENFETFDPTRFFKDDFLTRHPYAYVPFSAGPRNCIGQKFAMMEEKVILANILRNFEIKTFNDLMGIKAAPDLVYRPVKGLPVTLMKRKSTFN